MEKEEDDVEDNCDFYGIEFSERFFRREPLRESISSLLPQPTYFLKSDWDKV